MPMIAGRSSSARHAARACLALLIPLAAAPLGCAGKPELAPPQVLVAPYGTDGDEVIIAVAPLANESGTSAADPLQVGDAIVARLSEARGLSGVPMNRTIAAMRALGMTGVRTPAEARTLADALGADGIIAGSITAYDPYEPPKLGLALALFARRGALEAGPSELLDPRALATAPSDAGTTGASAQNRPLSVVSEHLDATSHEVLFNVRTYAEGRHEHDSALGWRSYTASMGRFTEFAAYWTVARLLEEERLRLARDTTALAR